MALLLLSPLVPICPSGLGLCKSSSDHVPAPHLRPRDLFLKHPDETEGSRYDFWVLYMPTE